MDSVATQYLKCLLEEGSLEGIDEDENVELSTFYNEEKFKRGQAVFHKYYASMLLGKLVALTIGLADPKLNSVLRLTNMSSEPKTARRRYASTVRHMLMWYEKDFGIDEQVRCSLRYVRHKHTQTSKLASRRGLGGFTQRDMALAQCGFIGVIVCKPDAIGMEDCSEEALEDFLYVWRIIGRLVGVRDRYNVCQNSLSETREIIVLILKEVLYSKLLNPSDDYKRMTYSLINGLKPLLFPLLDYEKFMGLTNTIAEATVSTKKMTTNHIASLGFVKWRYNRFIVNFICKYWMWFILRCPITAYFMFD